VVAPVLTAVKRWFFLDRRYNSQFANSFRQFAFGFWLLWLAMVVAMSVIGPDWTMAVGGAAVSALFVGLYRIVFKMAVRLNNWQEIDDDEGHNAGHGRAS
jgi:membrane associated rhomboid family serine protease